ncbi:MAG: hypothetical protein GYB67_14475 [Chloroflexi bacterium]|nr:hypothetical protein [Chloroflexota bacterium]
MSDERDPFFRSHPGSADDSPSAAHQAADEPSRRFRARFDTVKLDRRFFRVTTSGQRPAHDQADPFPDEPDARDRRGSYDDDDLYDDPYYDTVQERFWTARRVLILIVVLIIIITLLATSFSGLFIGQPTAPTPIPPPQSLI